MFIKKIEAREACDWLRAAGFPQYVQLFRDGKFPVELKWAKQDHGFLDNDAVDSLCRRLKTLNKSAELRLELRRTKRRDVESEEDDFCALSPNWSYDRTSKKWHRSDSGTDSSSAFTFSARRDASLSSCSSDSEGLDHVRPRPWSSPRPSARDEARSPGTSSPGSSGVSLDGSLERSQRKSGTSLLRKIDKLKLRRGTGGSAGHRSGMGPSLGHRSGTGPSLGHRSGTGPSLGSSVEEDDTLHCTDSPASSSCPSSPQTGSQSEASSRSHSQSESSSVVSTPSPVTRVRSNSKRGTETRSHNDQQDLLNQINLSHTAPALPSLRDSATGRTGSFHGYQRRQGSGRGHGTSSLSSVNGNAPGCDVADAETRLSVYDNVPPAPESDSAEVFPRSGSDEVFTALDRVLERISDLQHLVSTWTQDLCEDQGRDQDHRTTEEQRRPGGHQERTSREERPVSRSGSGPVGVQGLSWSRLALLQKLALLRLTALMDKFCPSRRQGWSWTVPKRQKSKASESSGCRVFGVPLLVNMQQTGEPLPPSVLRAMVYLKNECLDQMGVFRKSGLKSRIQALRHQLESGSDQVSFSGLCAFDVADLIKQYLRELPEPLLSAKLNQTFLHVYQYFPQELQLDAAQSAILLLPDERREALRTLLFFLRDVVSGAEENHMTHTNMAVCLAPSLFQLGAGRGRTGRPGQRKSSLGPDQKDLMENLAATQGLAHMIAEAHALFQLPGYWTSPDSDDGAWSPGYHGDAAEGEELSEFQLKLQSSTESLLKLSRDREQVWSSFTTPDGLQLDHTKNPTLSPLPLWRARLELDVPPATVLTRLLFGRAQFDPRLQQDARLRPLSPCSDLYQCQIQSQGHALGSIPATVYNLLRWWQSEPASGPMYMSSVSIPQQDVPKNVHVHCCMYLLEPRGDKKTLLTHLCSTEFRGRSLEWHVKVGGYLLANELLSIRDSFEQ